MQRAVEGWRSSGTVVVVERYVPMAVEQGNGKCARTSGSYPAAGVNVAWREGASKRTVVEQLHGSDSDSCTKGRDVQGHSERRAAGHACGRRRASIGGWMLARRRVGSVLGCGECSNLLSQCGELSAVAFA
eukprot:6167393-Pleurochrysis_carterae.AAC.1